MRQSARSMRLVLLSLPGGRSLAIVALLVGLGVGLAPQDAWAHAVLVRADPAPAVTLGAAPRAIRLSFSERPEPAPSEIRVLDADGGAEQSGRAELVDGDPLSLSVPVGPLGRGVYTVSWRMVSAIDGHATAGTYAFGVRASPTGAAAVATTSTPASSRLEFVARWIFIVGLVALLGAAVACLARFGGTQGTDLRLAAGGWLASVAGLLLLAEAQRRTAGSSLAELVDTAAGRALIWRAVAIAAAGAALLLAWRAPRIRRAALLGVAVAALVAMTVHVGAGHAAAGSWPSALTVSAQAAHFAAAGIWFGGLAALLLGLGGAPPAARAAAVRRFSIVATAALLVLIATGSLRAGDELSSRGELVSSGYGRAVLAKVALLLVIVGLAARNRRRDVPATDADLAPLRRRSRAELALAVCALAVAALLGTLAPPAPGQAGPAAGRSDGLSDSGSDLGTSVRVQLTAQSAQPGPNQFVVGVEDYDSGAPLGGRRVSLRFTPLDDPGVRPTSLPLAARPEGTYVGSGANLAFEGRWGVAVLIQQGADAVEVPLELDLPGPKQFVSVLRPPARPPAYTMQIGSAGNIRIVPDPERAGPSRVEVTVYTVFQNISRVDQLVLTAAAQGAPTRRQAVRRLGEGRFVADVELEAGSFTITVIARTSDGSRLRGAFDLKIPGE